MAELQCDRKISEVHGLKDQELTVGRHLILSCHGEIDASFNIKEAQIQLDEKSKNTVVVLKADFKSPSSIDVDMTFYSAGEFKFPDLILGDGKSEVHLGPQNFKIETILEKKADGKPQEPFGPILPASLTWPALYTLLLIGAFSLFIAGLTAGIIRRLRYKALIAKLKNHDSITLPDLQFYKSLRAAEANAYPIADIEKSFRLYLLRRFQVPAFDLKDRALLSFFKKSHPWLKKQRQEIKKIISDIDLLSTANSKASVASTEQDKKLLIQKMYIFVDHAEDLLQKAKL